MNEYVERHIDYMKNFSLKGKVCVVTGVANQYGIGAAYACALADAGADLILADRSEGWLEHNAEKARSYGARVYTHLCDISDRASVEELLAFTLEKFGKVDVLVLYLPHKTNPIIRFVRMGSHSLLFQGPLK